MLKESEIRVGRDLNYDTVTKELRGVFLPNEDSIRSAGVVYNRKRENFQQDNTENVRDGGRNYEDTEVRLKRTFEKKYQELADNLTGKH